ncbi:MAG: TrmH family RNA methyltransferase [Spirochaetia bacterium]|nr:TrmH family RNA methyltransferase [Spirochaetia bacterium]
MISVPKLLTLTPKHAARKAANTLDLAEGAFRRGDTSYAEWVVQLGRAFAADQRLPAELRGLSNAIAADAADAVHGRSAEWWARSCNVLRRGLEAYAGRTPADWDFREPLGLALDPGARRVFPGVRAYLEDLRSPFNVGSIFRTADAFGVDELVLSGFVPDPGHPRAQRTALGASSVVAWRRGGLDELAGAAGDLGPDAVFALELRGEPIDSFEFPARGLAVLGSEELGVSPEALALCGRRVSIPMLGAKGSLNVGVAFGVLMDAWRRSLAARGVAPEPRGPALV